MKSRSHWSLTVLKKTLNVLALENNDSHVLSDTHCANWWHASHGLHKGETHAN